jgi:flagellar L-ring protein precursor FlgH
MKINQKMLRIIPSGSIVILFLSLNFLIAESIWKDKNPYSTQAAFKVGSIVTVIIDEKIKADYKFKGNRNENLRIQLSPDKNIASFLPSADHSKNFNDKNKGDSQAKGRFQARISARITDIDKDTGILTLKGGKTIRYGDEIQSLQIEGFLDPANVYPDLSVDSHRVADLKILLEGSLVKKMKQDLAFDKEEPGKSDQIPESEKKKILLEYLKRFFGEIE